jgi:hypothetical protein
MQLVVKPAEVVADLNAQRALGAGLDGHLYEPGRSCRTDVGSKMFTARGGAQRRPSDRRLADSWREPDASCRPARGRVQQIAHVPTRAAVGVSQSLAGDASDDIAST